MVPGAQPEGRLLQVLLEQDARFSEEFLDYVDEHRERRSDPSFGHPDIWTSADAFYDITAWPLPLTYRLDAWTAGVGRPAAARHLRGTVPGGRGRRSAAHERESSATGTRSTGS